MAEKTCPKCGRSGPVEEMFGMRNMSRTLKDGSTEVTRRPQSYCRDCRSGRGADESLKSVRGNDGGVTLSSTTANAPRALYESSSLPESAKPSTAEPMPRTRLSAIAIPGLSPDSLGNYLASLGLLRVLSRKWPSTRIAWRDDVLNVVGGPSTLEELLEDLVRVASEHGWHTYDRRWLDMQKLGTSTKSGEPVAMWRAGQPEDSLEMLDAHLVAADKQLLNPLTGKGGSAGNRDFSDGWRRATRLLAATDKAKLRTHLRALLLGDAIEWLPTKVPLDGKRKKGSLNAASWFSQSNKLYNNGQSVAREAGLSPWLMVLACEGLPFFAGGTSRRLGARTRFGAFPYVTRPIAASAANEAGRLAAEIWAPLWPHPMTVVEIGTLFRRGRAEMTGRAASTPAAFATAIRKRGVDAGVREFRRFTLGSTTSANTFEPRLEGVFSVGAATSDGVTSLVLERVADLIEQHGFPRDSNKRFVGLRGPIEAAILDLAAAPDRSENGIALLDAVVVALDRIDRNRSFREKRVKWEPLPIAWLPTLFEDDAPSVEARLALALVSSFPEALPFAAFRFGVSWMGEGRARPRRFMHAKVAPARWVWGSGELPRVLSSVLSRALLELPKLELAAGAMQGRAPFPVATDDIRLWLAGEVDEPLLALWLSRLGLFDWTFVPEEIRRLLVSERKSALCATGELSLVGLVQPLTDRRRLIVEARSPDDILNDERGARTFAVARSLVALLRTGNVNAAVRLAAGRYAKAGVRVATFDVDWQANDPDRLVAALLFPISSRDRAALLERWLRPRRRTHGETHV